MRQVRILFRVMIETLIGLKQGGWSNWLVVSILAIALTTFGAVLQLTITLKSVVTSWGSQLEISAYLRDNYEPKTVAHEISQFPEVQFVEIVPKDIAWKELQSAFKVASVANPLPNTLHIKVASVEAVQQVASQVKVLPSVENVRYPLKVAQRINEFRHFLEIAGFAVTAALTTATLTVIGNTIHLVIQSRHREIEILSLMGVSPSYIRSPLILQGAIYGAISGLLAMSLLWGLHVYLAPYLSEQLIGFAPMLSQSIEQSLAQTFIALLILGVAVGASGAFWTSGRYIKV